MPDFQLPEFSADAKPDFTDGASCSAWLAELTVVNVALSQRQLRDQLSELNRFDVTAAQRLEVLEELRELIYFAQGEQIKKLANKPLPLTPVERGMFVISAQLWQELLIGYERCIESAIKGKLEGQTALVCQRALDCIGSSMFDHCRAYHAIPDAYWLTLHQIYRLAEDAGAVAKSVTDPVKKLNVCCTEVYVRALLLMLANPNEQQQKALNQIQGWLQRWSQFVPVRRSPPEDKGLPPLMLDASAAAGAYREFDAGGRSPSHWLDMGELARALKKLVVRLRKGEAPASLGLGEDSAMPGVEQLLIFLFRVWCEGKNERVQGRRSISAKAQVCSSMASIHYRISGKIFRQPGHATELTRRERLEIATFGHASKRHEEAHIESGAYPVEDWLLHEESLSGLRLYRPALASGARYGLTQLLAVRPGDAKNFFIGVVRWLKTESDEGLHLGARIIPGVPRAVAVRPTGINASSEKYVPALFCPALAALGSPASLILPPGWFRASRIIEVYGDTSESLQLSSVIERGSDFERVAIEPAR
jgi:hypothetical protein